MSKGKTPSGTWKAFELRIARMFGAERESKRGLGLSVPDVIAPIRMRRAVILSIECKLLQGLSRQVQVAVDKSIKERKSQRHIPIAVMKEKHMPDDSSIVAMRLEDFKRLFIMPRVES